MKINELLESANYAENLAARVYENDPDLQSEDDILNAGFVIAKEELGAKRAQYNFAYDEDFASDYVSAYRWQQRNQVNEISTATLDKYTKAANADYDKAKEEGDSKRMYKRGLNLMKASGKKIDNDVKAMQKARGVAEEEKLNELDMWAPHTAYIRTAPGIYFKADWRQSEKLTGDDATSFIKVAPLQPQVVKSMGLDAKLNDKSARRYLNRRLARGGPNGSSGPLSDRGVMLVDLTDEQSKRFGVPQLPPGVAAELYKHIEKQGVAETSLNPNDPKEDYNAKRKALQDLMKDPNVDQKAVQQRWLDLEKEAKAKGVAEEKEKGKEKLSGLDKEIRKELDPQTTELINIARAKYPSAKSDIAAVLKLLQRTKLHSDQEDRQHDSAIADLQQRVDRLEQNK